MTTAKKACGVGCKWVYVLRPKLGIVGNFCMHSSLAHACKGEKTSNILPQDEAVIKFQLVDWLLMARVTWRTSLKWSRCLKKLRCFYPTNLHGCRVHLGHLKVSDTAQEGNMCLGFSSISRLALYSLLFCIKLSGIDVYNFCCCCGRWIWFISMNGIKTDHVWIVIRLPLKYQQCVQSKIMLYTLMCVCVIHTLFTVKKLRCTYTLKNCFQCVLWNGYSSIQSVTVDQSHQRSTY